jgi:hypothetical protein
VPTLPQARPSRRTFPLTRSQLHVAARAISPDGPRRVGASWHAPETIRRAANQDAEGRRRANRKRKRAASNENLPDDPAVRSTFTRQIAMRLEQPAHPRSPRVTRRLWSLPSFTNELPRDRIAQPDDTIGVFFGRAQAKRHVPMARRHQWNALADEGGNNVDVELVYFAGIKK